MIAWWLAPGPARRLAMLRALLGAYALVYVVVRLPHLIAVGRFAAQEFAPVGPVELLDAPLPDAAAVALVIAAVPLGIAFVLGAHHRVTGPAFAAVLLWIVSYRNSWGMVFHTENLLVLHVLVLGVTRSADALSRDARGRPDPGVGPHWGWPVRLLCAVTVATYVIAGITKLQVSGLAWIGSDTLRGLVAYDNLRKVELGDPFSPIGAALVGQRWLFGPLAALSLLIELGAPLALVSRRLGRWWAALAWSFHLGVLALMAILFHYPLSGAAFAPMLDVEKIDLRRLARRGRVQSDRDAPG